MNRALHSLIRSRLTASNPNTLRVLGGRARLIAETTGAAPAPVFDVLAYNGDKLVLPGVALPVVFDLATLKPAEAGVPALYQHDPCKIVGMCDAVTIAPDHIRTKITAKAVGESADYVRNNAAAGYDWQVSVGVDPGEMVTIEAGVLVSINNREIEGPFYKVMNGQLREISFVSVGADSATYAKLVASLYRANAMTFNEWLASIGFDASQMSEDEVAIAQRIYDAMQSQTAAATGKPEEKEQMEAAAKLALKAGKALHSMYSTRLKASAKPPVNPPATLPVTDTLAATRAAHAAELDRINMIEAAAKQFGNPMNGGESIAAKAIRDNWSVDRAKTEFELANLRAQRSTVIVGRGTSDVPRSKLLEVAMLQATKVNSKLLEASYDAKTLQAAHTEFRGRIGVVQLLLEAALANGYTGSVTNPRGNLPAILKAAFSTQDVPGILSNTANKYMVQGFMAVDQAWRKFCRVSSVVDFKEKTGYRGVGSFRFREMGPQGKFQNATFGETAYGNRAKTYGIGYSIERQALRNDDLGVFSEIPNNIGRGGAVALNRVIFTEFLDNTTFFSAGNNNTSTGALGITGLNNALTRFRKQTDDAGEYLLTSAAILLAPVELEETAVQLYADRNRGGGATGDAEQNPHYQKYEPVTSPYLSDTTITGNSATAYYLLANPVDIPVMEVVFLDGQEVPYVETVDADFDELGIRMRGYYDFGARKQEFRGGVRSTGV